MINNYFICKAFPGTMLADKIVLSFPICYTFSKCVAVNSKSKLRFIVNFYM
ncbi:hypothetical protein ACFP3I_05470 [Chryseobacterium arachidis]|uniref:hypothetical protein n=1 Tax=Chryseobacterium arachidis TaxID=1416778 RepID=UPI003606EB43